MHEKTLISIGKLSKFSRVPRTTLIHYDKIGVLKPEFVGKNNYRYYSFSQIGWVNLIRTMQFLGMPLKDIISISNHRTPETILKLFSDHVNNLNSYIAKSVDARKLMLTLQTTIENSIAVDENKIEFIEESASNIFLGPQTYYSNGQTNWDGLFDFYNFCEQKGMSINMYYSAWAMFSEERIKRGDWKNPDKFYLNYPDGEHTKPTGWYVVGYGRGYYAQTDMLYEKMITYIKENNLEICGPAYETYPLNEISINDPANYLIRISITARKK
jgi:DNA-binding transcriptional MerR regulator/effector-binding domain-containing protein